MRLFVRWSFVSLITALLLACGGGSSSGDTGPSDDNQGPDVGYQLIAAAQGLSGELELGVKLKASSADDAALVRQLSLKISDAAPQILLDKIQLDQLVEVELISKPANQLCEIAPRLQFEFSQPLNQQLSVICQSVVEAQINFSKPAAYDFNQLSLASIFEEKTQLMSSAVSMQLTPNSFVLLKAKADQAQAESVIYASVVGVQSEILIDEFSTALSLLLQDAAIAKAIAERDLALVDVVAQARAQREQLPYMRSLYQAIATAANNPGFNLLEPNAAISANVYPALEELAQLIAAMAPLAPYTPDVKGEVFYQDSSIIASHEQKANQTEFYFYNLGERYLALQTDSSNSEWHSLSVMAPSSVSKISIDNQDLINQVINFSASGASLNDFATDSALEQDLGKYFSRNYLHMGLLQFLSQSQFDAALCLGESKLANLSAAVETKAAELLSANNNSENKANFAYRAFNQLGLAEVDALDFNLATSNSSPNFILAEFKTTAAGKILYCEQLGIAGYLSELEADVQVQAIAYFKQLLAFNRLAHTAIEQGMAAKAAEPVAKGLLFEPADNLTRFSQSLVELPPLSAWQYNQSYRVELTIDNETLLEGSNLIAAARCFDNQDSEVECQLSWDLGDTTQVSGANVDHAYQQAGLYQLELVASVQGVEIARMTRNINVEQIDNSFVLRNKVGIELTQHSANVSVGQNYQLALSVSNTGNTSYALDFDLSHDGGFNLYDEQNQSLTSITSLAPGETYQFFVSFDAVALGDYSASLTLANSENSTVLDIDIAVVEISNIGEYGYWQHLGADQDSYAINRVEPIQEYTAAGFAVIKAYSDESNTPALFIKLYDYLGIGNYSLSDRGSESALGFISYGADLADNHRTIGSSSPLFADQPASGSVSISESDDAAYYRVEFNFDVYAQDCISSALCQHQNVRGEFKMLKPQ